MASAADTSPDSSAATNAATAAETVAGDAAKEDDAVPAKGHGRNGAEAYTGGEQIRCRTNRCRRAMPVRSARRVRSTNGKARVLVRLVGQPPIGAMIYDFRSCVAACAASCFTAAPPAGVGDKKRDATVGSMIAVLKYGRARRSTAEKLQASLGIPLPASTQWEIVRDKAERIAPALEELLRPSGGRRRAA